MPEYLNFQEQRCKSLKYRVPLNLYYTKRMPTGEGGGVRDYGINYRGPGPDYVFVFLSSIIIYPFYKPNLSD
jgi:hypothetical protein